MTQNSLLINVVYLQIKGVWAMFKRFFLADFCEVSFDEYGRLSCIRANQYPT